MILSNNVHLKNPPVMKTEKRIRDNLQGHAEHPELTKDLAISLKFHHYQTLRKLSLEEALQAMAQVWESANR